MSQRIFGRVAGIAAAAALCAVPAFAADEDKANKEEKNDRNKSGQFSEAAQPQEDVVTNQGKGTRSATDDFDTERHGRYGRYQHHMENRYHPDGKAHAGDVNAADKNVDSPVAEAGSNDQKSKSNQGKGSGAWVEWRDAQRSWRDSDTYWRETDRHWHNEERASDPGREEYVKKSNDYWRDSDDFWNDYDKNQDDGMASQSNQGKGTPATEGDPNQRNEAIGADGSGADKPATAPAVVQ